jgi:hypothetical protein
MPLSTEKLRFLSDRCEDAAENKYYSVQLEDLSASECACWRWATSGLALHVRNDPAAAFTYIAFGFSLDENSVWHRLYRDELQRLRASYSAYENNGHQSIDGTPYSRWFDQAVAEVGKLACDNGGLSVIASDYDVGHDGESYEICVYPKRFYSNNEPCPPNYTHWWLRINLEDNHYVAVEMFPGSNHLVFRLNNSYEDDAVVTMIRVADLLPSHIAIIDAVIPWNLDS